VRSAPRRFRRLDPLLHLGLGIGEVLLKRPGRLDVVRVESAAKEFSEHLIRNLGTVATRQLVDVLTDEC
jgi:hypothetical protein